MRGYNPIVIVVLALAAGCMEKNEDPVDAASHEAPESAPAESAASDTTNGDVAPAPPPVKVEGDHFLPPTTGNDRAESRVDLPDATPDQAIRGTFRLGSRYMGLDVPPLLPEVIVELRDVNEGVLAEILLNAESPEGAIDATTATGGALAVIFLSYGGSDGSANGDHVAYVIEIA